jgi:hypothetical protein
MAPHRVILSFALAVSATLASAQTTQTPGPGVSPASAAPQTEHQPNLRTDSEPRMSPAPPSDSGPAPETLGVDATPYVDLGPDWSKPARENETETLKRIVTHKGVTRVEEITTYGVTPSPVTNPPVPPTKQIDNIPLPPVKMMPKPPDPLAAVPQPTEPIRP